MTASKLLILLPFILLLHTHSSNHDWHNLYNAVFFKKNGKRRYKYLVVDHAKSYFVINDSKKQNKFTEDQIIEMLNFLIDNIFVQFGGRVFQQTI